MKNLGRLRRNICLVVYDARNAFARDERSIGECIRWKEVIMNATNRSQANERRMAVYQRDDDDDDRVESHITWLRGTGWILRSLGARSVFKRHLQRVSVPLSMNMIFNWMEKAVLLLAD